MFVQHEMKLNDEYFNLIKDGAKTYELRLFDEKRKLLKVGDEILFKNVSNLKQTFKAQITNLIWFKSFSDAIKFLDRTKIGFSGKTEQEIISVYQKFYSKEEEKTYGVLAIELKI